jgi:hypothetical protein
MKKSTVVIKFTLAILMLSCCKFAEGETTAIPTLSTTLFKKQFLAGEPIIVNLKLANESLEPLPRVFSSNEDFANTPDFTFIVTAVDDSKICEMHRNGADIIRVVLGVVGSGEFWQCEQMFLPRINLQKKVKPESQNSIALLSPGLYKLTAKVLWNPPQKKSVLITSNNVEFQITEPTGADAESAKLMQLPELGGFFEGILEGKPKVITALLAKYPESTYARYARARLILDEEKHIWNTNRSANTASERKGLAKLISDGLDYVEKNEDMPLSDNILLYCARMSRVLDRENESVQILNRLIKEFPQSDAAEAAQHHLEKWENPFEPGQKPVLPTTAGKRVVAYMLIIVLGAVVIIVSLLLKKKAISRGKQSH